MVSIYIPVVSIIIRVRGIVCVTSLYSRPRGIYILTSFSAKTSPGRNFPPSCHCLSGCCFALLKHGQMILNFVGQIKVALGKPQTARGKLKVSPGTGKAKFSLCGGKKSTGSRLSRTVIERCSVSSWSLCGSIVSP